MGKLKFTLSNIWFWISFVLIAFLTENLALLTGDPKAGFNFGTLIAISIPMLLCLVLYYFINHKDNKVKIDYVLLPCFIIATGVILASIWLNQGQTFMFADGSDSITVSYSFFDKLRSSIILVLFMAFLYAGIFVFTINSPSSRRIHWLALVGVMAGVISLGFSLCTEMNDYIAIFKGNNEVPISIDSFYGNKNYYGGVLLIAFLSCIVANYYKPRMYNFILVVVFTVAILASASVLPLLIAIVALPIYLFEEVIRFAVKKRWLCSFFATFAIFLVLALFALFYIGVTHKWDGFIGFDVYLTEMFKQKNFSTFTGRTLIWKEIFPLCFDSTLHTWLGHGFMISEKSILAITGAMNNAVELGVRTTHNGYLQIMFEYGIIGFVAHLALVCYFIYSCIRMLLEKKFHFVFVYAFVCSCCAVYNYCESSSFFDAGVKEIYMTLTFMLPVISEFKYVNRKNKVAEIKNYENIKEHISAETLGKTIGTVIVSVIIEAGISMLSTWTLNQRFLLSIMMNIVIGGLILLIFVPYLTYLYRKDTEKPWFILHSVFNGLFMVALVTISCILFRGKSEIMYIPPILLVGFLLIDTMLYSFFKKGSFKQWLSIFVKGSFICPAVPAFGGLIVGGIAFLAFGVFGEMNWFIYFMMILITLIGYYAAWHFNPFKEGKSVLNDLNQYKMYRLKKTTIKDETYYG